MKSHHVFAVSILTILLLGFVLIYSISPSSSAVDSQCSPVNLNQRYDLGTVGYGKNITNAFLVPSEYPYQKIISIVNASIFGYCSTPNFNCPFYVNGAFCGIMPTNMTWAANSSQIKTLYSMTPCLSSIKGGTNVLTLTLNNNSFGGAGNIDRLFVEMQVLPATC